MEKNGEKKQTLRDVAEDVGVSISVVSRVLRNKQKRIAITADTRRRILAAAVKRGVCLNNNIGVLISDRFLDYDLIHYPFIAGVFARANQLGYGIFSAFFADIEQNVLDIPAFIEERNVRGVVSLGPLPEHIISFLDDNFIPCVLADIGGESIEDNCVSIDYYGTTLELLTHLKDSAYNEFILVSISGDDPASFERIEFDCFNDFLIANDFRGEIIQHSDSFEDELELLAQKVSASTERTVFIAESRMLTVELLKLFALKGLIPQHNVGLVGNNLLSQQCVPPFISVKYDFHQMGVDSISMIDEIVKNQNIPCVNKIVKGDILK